MSKFKIIRLIDRIFISVSIFLIIYAWINFFIRDLWITFFFSLFFTFACVFLLFYILNKQSSKKTASKEYFKNVEEKFLAFKLLSKSDKLKLIKSIVEKNNECKKLKDTLLFEKDNHPCQILLALDKEKITQFDLEKLVSMKEKNTNILKIICSDYEPNLNTKFLKNLEIEIIPKKKLYDEFFLPYNIYPDCSNLTTGKDKKSFKQVVKNFFIPSKAKSYFLCGLILIFSSIILPYHFYYLIFGSVLLTFSIICKLQPIFNR